jgi:hypothetical protein
MIGRRLLGCVAALAVAACASPCTSQIAAQTETEAATAELVEPAARTPAAIVAALAKAAIKPRSAPVPLIFDTDMGNDVDDALALGVIHALQSRGECRLLAVTASKDDELSAPFIDVVNTFYGRGEIPIGVVRDGVKTGPSKYTALADVRDGAALRYPHDLANAAGAPDAVAVLRRTLAAAEDESVVIVQVGFFTNLARLLASPPDGESPLSGFELIRQKVRQLSVMAGDFSPGGPQPEFNVKLDVPSAQAVVDGWPTPIVFSGVEIGVALPFPAASIEQDFSYAAHHPLAEAYWLYEPPPHQRPTWDLTSVLQAVRSTRAYFDLSPPGRVSVTNDALTRFAPAADGLHRYLVLRTEQRDRTLEALGQLASQPPPG